MSLRCCSICTSMSNHCCSNILIFLLLLASWFFCIDCSIFSIIKFTLSASRSCDLFTDACNPTIILASVSSTCHHYQLDVSSFDFLRDWKAVMVRIEKAGSLAKDHMGLVDLTSQITSGASLSSRPCKFFTFFFLDTNHIQPRSYQRDFLSF
jgi:hypothetical protein